MSNLSDLLPAGASAKQLTFTDSGSGIATKKPVILNSDGTVAEVTSSSVTEAAGSATTFASVAVNGLGAAYDTANDKVVVFYSDADDGFGTGKVVIGTVSGTSISFGSPVTVTGNRAADQSVVFDPDSGNVVLFYQDTTNSYYGTAIVGTVSGTSISFGSAVVFSSSSNNYNSAVYDTSADRVYNSYTDAGNSNYGTAIVGTVSGTSISFGSAVVFNSAATYPTSSAFDSNANKVVTAYYNASDGYSKGIVGTVSGTSVSFGSATTFHTGTGGYSFASVYDVNANKTLISFKDVNNSDYGSSIVGTVSGTSISFGTAAAFEDATTDQIKGCYDSNTNKVVIVYRDGGSSYYGTAVNATISGTSVTFTTPFQLIAGNTNPHRPVFDPDSNKVAYSFFNSTTGGGEGLIYTPPSTSTNLTAQAFVGVADSAISASAAGSVIVQGGTVTGPTASVSIAESLSSAFLYGQDAPADPVYAYKSGTGSDDLIIAYYINDGVTQGARIQAGTITTGNITYGSSAEIGSTTAFVYYYSIVYDSTNNKFVVFWRSETDGYIYGAVVTLTGSSISYGATTAVYSAVSYSSWDTFSATYDPDTDRVILGVCDNSDGYAYSVVIELGSTTIDTVGTPEKIDSASATAGYAKNIALCYDTTEDKVIATYVYTGGGGSYYLRVAAGTVTGAATNSISWGSSSVVYSGDANYASIAYNATDQRVVIVYKQIADGKGYSSVATVSGTTVTANTPSLMYDGSGTLYYTDLVYDSYVNKMVVYMRAYQGEAVNGAIDTSANSITWSTPFYVDSDAYNPPFADFNASTNQTIIGGAGTTKATAKSFIYTVPGTISGQPLTIGTKYYVTTTGAFSSSADTPSVNAGLAISTTSLLLNGDS